MNEKQRKAQAAFSFCRVIPGVDMTVAKTRDGLSELIVLSKDGKVLARRIATININTNEIEVEYHVP